MKKKKLVIVGICVILAGLFACMPRVKTDLKSFRENPEEYANKEVIFMVTLENLLDNPKSYLKKKVEITGFVQDGPKNRNDWFFILEDKAGRKIKCYETNYRVQTWLYPVSVLRKAKREQTEIAVVGKFQRGDRIELDWIVYQDMMIDTDYLPHYVHPQLL